MHLTMEPMDIVCNNLPVLELYTFNTPRPLPVTIALLFSGWNLQQCIGESSVIVRINFPVFVSQMRSVLSLETDASESFNCDQSISGGCVSTRNWSTPCAYLALLQSDQTTSTERVVGLTWVMQSRLCGLVRPSRTDLCSCWRTWRWWLIDTCQNVIGARRFEFTHLHWCGARRCDACPRRRRLRWLSMCQWLDLISRGTWACWISSLSKVPMLVSIYYRPFRASVFVRYNPKFILLTLALSAFLQLHIVRICTEYTYLIK